MLCDWASTDHEAGAQQRQCPPGLSHCPRTVTIRTPQHTLHTVSGSLPITFVHICEILLANLHSRHYLRARSGPTCAFQVREAVDSSRGRWFTWSLSGFHTVVRPFLGTHSYSGTELALNSGALTPKLLHILRHQDHPVRVCPRWYPRPLLPHLPPHAAAIQSLQAPPECSLCTAPCCPQLSRRGTISL